MVQACVQDKIQHLSFSYTKIHYHSLFLQSETIFSLVLLQGCQQSDQSSTGLLQICRYGDCKTPDQAKNNTGIPGQSTDSISADMETARLQQTRPNTAPAFQVSQLTVYMSIWRLQDSSRPGQIQPWHSSTVFYVLCTRCVRKQIRRAS